MIEERSGREVLLGRLAIHSLTSQYLKEVQEENPPKHTTAKPQPSAATLEDLRDLKSVVLCNKMLLISL